VGWEGSVVLSRSGQAEPKCRKGKGTWARAEGVRPQSQESHKGEENVDRDRTGREG
jgi:hypothetical protein